MRVLAPIDLSRGGHDAVLARAAWLAALAGDVVDVLFVTAEPDRHEAALRKVVEELPPGVRGDGRLASGDPAEVIVALSGGYDAVVLGPRHPNLLERLLLGSVTGQTLGRAKCSVLVPHGELQARATPRMLVGVDVHGAHPDWIVREAGTWAQRLRARLDAVYADPEGPPYVPDASFREAARKQWEKGLEKERSAAQALLDAHVPDEARGKAFLAHGGPDTSLVDFSDDYDLVLVGTRPRPGLSGLLLGSVAEFVVRNARCDVLTLHSGARA